MRASEAMRLGAMLGPHLQCTLYSVSQPGGSCALGAIGLALGADQEKLMKTYDLIEARYPWMLKQVPHPIGGNPSMIEEIIMQLNDYYLWSRERIADWLATVEPVEEPVVESKETEAACDTCLAAQ